MKKRTTLLLICIIACNYTPIFSAEIPSGVIEYIESVEESKIDGEEIVELLNELEENPLDINNSSEEELLQIPDLTEMDVNNILLHRKRYGKFQTLYELKHLPNFTQEKIFKIIPYLTLSNDKDEKPLQTLLKENNHQLNTLYQRNFPQKKGYKRIKEKDPYYLGDPNKYYFKYRFNASNTFYFGYSGEKDAGEVFWNKQSKVFDFHSFYFQVNQYKVIKTLCLGDYKVNFGQGLIIGTGSLFGKSSNTVHPNNQKPGINRYTSLNENNYFRGIGATIKIKKWDYSLFFSRKKRDANLSHSGITSFRTDGMHRSKNEISKTRNIHETIIGGNIKYRNDLFDVGCTFLYTQFSDSLLPTEQLYLKHRLRETDWHLNVGVHYKLILGRILIYGETALDRNGGVATLNAATFTSSSRIAFMLLHRSYQAKYQSLYGNGFSENSNIENEKGLYLGCKLLPFKRITVSAYTDLYRFPWAKYGIDRSSWGKDFLVHLQHNTSNHINMQVRYKKKIKSEDDENKQTLRYQIKGEWNKISLQTQLEGNQFSKEKIKSYGWIVAQDLQLKELLKKLSINIRYAYFKTDNYNNRLYLYEKDVTSSFSMPLHYGEGHRIGINIAYKIRKQLQLSLNGNSFIYTDDRETCGSNYEESIGDKTYQIKCCIKWKID